MGQELHRRCIKQRPTGALPAPGRPNPTRIHQHVERALGNLDTADRLDLGAAGRLVIGDDRQVSVAARESPRGSSRVRRRR